MNFTEYFDWKILLFVAVVTSVVVEGLKTWTPEFIGGKFLLPVVAFAVTILRIPFEHSGFAEWQTFLLNILFTMSFSVLFYTYLGEWTVSKLFAFIKTKLDGFLTK